ncbi:hypothetical protein J2Z69_000297 [Paenibacillus shirakamiensis]|uniref:General stress protein 17M-like domain-containing protein n=1 Tax=Paenibacillus shirakamiensis TaxID=1265935 RepID=A0ABS4JC25_9BACL|nr:general stress protein [Paenibacillus shirakamiensis]MBP1999278.1 hypothetical protein [Paenibacillus shirakamiensis]
MAKLIIGVFRAIQDVSILIGELEKEGLDNKHVSILSKKIGHLHRLSETAGTPKPDAGNAGKSIFGLLKSVAGTMEDVPQEVVTTGPVSKRLAGAEIGAGSDDLVVALVGAGIPEEDAKAYEAHLMEDRLLVMAECPPEQAEQVSKIFQKHHALGID